MKRPSTPCKILLGIVLMIPVAGRCEEQPQPPVSQGPAVVRKKIEALQPSLVQAVKPSDQKEVQPLTAEGSLEAEAP